MKHTKVIQKCSIKQIKNSGNFSIRRGGGYRGVGEGGGGFAVQSTFNVIKRANEKA